VLGLLQAATISGINSLQKQTSFLVIMQKPHSSSALLAATILMFATWFVDPGFAVLRCYASDSPFHARCASSLEESLSRKDLTAIISGEFIDGGYYSKDPNQCPLMEFRATETIAGKVPLQRRIYIDCVSEPQEGLFARSQSPQRGKLPEQLRKGTKWILCLEVHRYQGYSSYRPVGYGITMVPDTQAFRSKIKDKLKIRNIGFAAPVERDGRYYYSPIADSIWTLDPPMPEGFSLGSSASQQGPGHDIDEQAVTYAHEQSRMELMVARSKIPQVALRLDQHLPEIRSIKLLSQKNAVVDSKGTLVVGGRKLSYRIGRCKIPSSAMRFRETNPKVVRTILEGEFERRGSRDVMVQILPAAGKPLDMSVVKSFFSHVQRLKD
jgi:hypothetical protein